MEKRFYIICAKCGSYAVATTRRDGFAYAYHFEVGKGVISIISYSILTLSSMMFSNQISVGEALLV